MPEHFDRPPLIIHESDPDTEELLEALNSLLNGARQLLSASALELPSGDLVREEQSGGVAPITGAEASIFEELRDSVKNAEEAAQALTTSKPEGRSIAQQKVMNAKEDLAVALYRAQSGEV